MKSESAVKHTPGTLRAVWAIRQRITEMVLGVISGDAHPAHPFSDSELAEIIDRETGTRELLSTLEGIAETLDKWSTCPEEILAELLDRAQAAITKAQGE